VHSSFLCDFRCLLFFAVRAVGSDDYTCEFACIYTLLICNKNPGSCSSGVGIPVNGVPHLRHCMIERVK